MGLKTRMIRVDMTICTHTSIILLLISMVIGQNWELMNKDNIVINTFLDNLYQSVSMAEMSPDYYQNVLKQPHPYIRTSVAPARGSTAYGPLQLTSGADSMVQNILGDEFHPLRTGNNSQGFKLTADEIEYMSKMVEQGKKFLLYGREPNKPGYDPKYDYSSVIPGSGQGDLASKDDMLLYDSMGKKILGYEYFDQAKSNPEIFLKNWKMGAEKTMDDFEKWGIGDNAKQYIQRFQSNLAPEILF